MNQYIGKMLDNRYEILDVIGVGGMAVVYKAYCHRLHRFVAIKVLKKDLASDAEFRRRFHEEAQAVAMLSHPNIVSVYDVSKGDDLDYIVMELIDGITLKQYMQKKDGRLNWRESLYFITQIVRALGHAHSRGIIHRDIKPQNIMVLRDGSVKVADFGIARIMSAAQNTMTQEALGSVHYISPEQARGSHIDARADIYSAGVVLYEMLTGRLPFDGDTPVSVAIQHINSIPLSPRELDPTIPEALEAITMKAMAPNPDDRYADAGEMLADLETRTKEQTGIKNMKVSYNKVFGYYIEVAKSQTGLVPPDWARKQTTVNAERYISQELKDLEHTILSAQDKVVALEYQLFCQLKEQTCAHVAQIQKAAAAVAQVDVLTSFAVVAAVNGYCMPQVDGSDSLSISEGRHPVVEKVLPAGTPFVPNDTHMDSGEDLCAIITGPNMAGKSTYMRQVALIVLMAQMGSFVPARSARIGVVDRVFTRIGASDDLSSGQSTFMVEMNEVAGLLKNATARSLLILDEIGRGTSTYDGMAIARAVLEYCADRKRLGAKTLFATHYHELTALEGEIPGVKNYNIAAKKRGNDLIFLRKIVRGGADQSYGIEVAKLAGVPDRVIRRARTILEELESGSGVLPAGGPALPADGEQVSLMDLGSQTVLKKLRMTDVNILSPIEALNLLAELKQDLNG